MNDNLADVTSEANEIVEGIAEILPRVLDGREAIMMMKNEGSRNWRQMEWIGFWFEHLVDTKVDSALGVRRGPSYGKTRFDIERQFVWDLKAHPAGSADLILNDQEAVEECIDEHGGLGFIIVNGTATYDTDGAFKAWHDDLKGKKSDYEVERENRGARSRIRKTSFRPGSIDAVWLADANAISNGRKGGWLGGFQEGMRNSDGQSRRPKYKLNTVTRPSGIVLAHRDLN